MRIDAIERDVVISHIIFAVICLAVLMVKVNVSVGVKLFHLVVLYDLIILSIIMWFKYNELVDIWVLGFVLSLFMVFPDWFLASQLNVLSFPQTGFFRIGPVSGYMLGLWTIPVFMILFTGRSMQLRYSRVVTYLFVALVSLVIFALAEQFMWTLPSWHARNVFTIGHIAAYIIIPEVIFGLSAYACYEFIRGKNHWLKVPCAFGVMLLYLGSASFFYFLIEKIILRP